MDTSRGVPGVAKQSIPTADNRINLAALARVGLNIRPHYMSGAVLTAHAEDQYEILIETINPSDITPEELWELADLLSREVPQFIFTPAYEDQRGAGVTWHEVIRLWVENEDIIKGGVFGFVLEHVYQTMRARFKREGGKRRPKSIIISSMQNGREIMCMIIEDVESEPVEREVSPRIRTTPQKRQRPHD
jgi:hypothetical protein